MSSIWSSIRRISRRRRSRSFMSSAIVMFPFFRWRSSSSSLTVSSSTFFSLTLDNIVLFTSSTNPDVIPPGQKLPSVLYYHRVRPEPAKLFQVNALSQTLLHSTSQQSLFIHFPTKQARQPPRSQPAYSAISCSGTHLFAFLAGTARKANRSYLLRGKPFHLPNSPRMRKLHVLPDLLEKQYIQDPFFSQNIYATEHYQNTDERRLPARWL